MWVVIGVPALLVASRLPTAWYRRLSLPFLVLALVLLVLVLVPGIGVSVNGNQNWIDIGEGKLPSRFGFPIAVHPHQPETIYIVLEESDQYRLSVDGSFAVWRSQDSGNSWQRLNKGLPENAHLVVLREAMATDQHEQAGIYIGTTTGQVFATRDSGDSWEKIADYLPRILSVETATIA